MNFSQAIFELAAGKASQLPDSTIPEIVFSGRSNVGKSSLINKLVNRKSLARVSATPGKTGTINFYRLAECRLVDLPGYGYAKVSQNEKLRWAELVEGYFAQDRNIALVVQIVDMRHEPTADDKNMIAFLYENKFPFLIAATKSDKLNQTQRKTQLALLDSLFGGMEGVPIVPFSSVKGEGLEEMKRYLSESCDSR